MSAPRGTRRVRSTVAAAAAYALATLVMTWPLAAGLTRELPADLGDPLLNAWILGWGADAIAGMAAGAMSFRDYWNANIFHPAPLALAYSEHLFALALQILPVHLATDNLLLGYNLLFLSTFVLSGLGMYLLVADVTGSRAAAFVAGLFYAFVPYRFAHLPHLQVLSSQWMPFALLGFRRYVATGGWRPLAGGTAALVAQNLSCGYYLIFFAPLVPAWVLLQMAACGCLRAWDRWVGLGAAAAVTAACTLLFLFPYLELRALEGFERSLAEIRFFSPDLLGYLTAPESLRLWGSRLRLAPGPEGELFLGTVPVVLGVAALGLAVVRAWRAGLAAPASTGRARAAIRALGIAAALAGVALAALAVTGPVRFDGIGLPFRMTGADRPLIVLAAAAAGLVGLSARLRSGLRAFAAEPAVLALGFFLFAVAMSLGPSPTIAGEPAPWLAVYLWALEYVPGFDGLRVPGRYAMIAALFLALAAGTALARLAAAGRAGAATVILCGATFLVEAAAMPIEISRRWDPGEHRQPPGVRPGPEAPPLYRHLASLPRGSVVVLELPFGDHAWDLHAVYYAAVHRQRLVNGYSGGFPRDYQRRKAAIAFLVTHPDVAWRAVVDSGATHVVLHEHAYYGDRADRVRAFLLAQGAVLDADFGDGELLFRVPREPTP